jgi:hypothetical protein
MPGMERRDKMSFQGLLILYDLLFLEGVEFMRNMPFDGVPVIF